MRTSITTQKAQAQLGIKKLRKHQIKPIQSILNDYDTMVIAPTSAGKSAIYQLPALIKAKDRQWTLVIEPTLALIGDQVQKLQEKGIAAASITGRNGPDHDKIFQEIWNGQITLLYTTPEQLQTRRLREVMQANNPWLVVIDEAHCVTVWGYTFRPKYLQIKHQIAQLKRRPVIAAFTATAPHDDQKDIQELLGMQHTDIYSMSLRRENITLLKEDCTGLDIDQHQRLKRVGHYIRKYGEDGRVVVYCSSRRNVDIVTNYLKDKFSGVAKCHAYMDEDERAKQEFQFICGKKRIMVATTAFGMGVDVSDIRLVLHFNLPLSVIDYYQQIGRAGRDGNPAHAVLLYAKEDIDLNQYILKHGDYEVSLKDQLAARLDEMADIAFSDCCLVRQVLGALGEESSTNCNRCTNCQRERRGLL